MSDDGRNDGSEPETGEPGGSAARDLAMYSFLHVFANDGVVERNELAFMERLALRDGVVDDKEREVLRRIFARIDAAEISPEAREAVRRFRERYDIR